MIATLMVTFVLLLNIVLVIVISTTWTLENGVATAFTGSCRTAERWTTAIHLLINLLSSLLLGASNYCMQRLAAPTRAEVDDAHAKKKWADIGIPSIKNLLFIGKGRVVLWLLLGLSSLPLHLFYNSVVFEELAGNNVQVLVVTPEFFTNATKWSLKRSFGGPVMLQNKLTDNEIVQLQATLLDGKYQDRRLFENITGSDCVSRYNSPVITDTGNAFAVPAVELWERLQLGVNNSLYANFNTSGGLAIDHYSHEIKYDCEFITSHL